jgi:hypothetical protein
MKITKAISHQKKKECIDYAFAHPEIDTAKLAADFGIDHLTLSGCVITDVFHCHCPKFGRSKHDILFFII